MYTLSLKKQLADDSIPSPANGFYCTDDNTDGECSIANDIAADVTVPNDGTWQKGDTLLSTPETGFCVLSKSCSSYVYWENKKDTESSVV